MITFLVYKMMSVSLCCMYTICCFTVLCCLVVSHHFIAYGKEMFRCLKYYYKVSQVYIQRHVLVGVGLSVNGKNETVNNV